MTNPPQAAAAQPPAPVAKPAAPAPAAAPANLPPGVETADQALTRALNAAKLRRVNEAMGICRDVLAQVPDLPGALGLLGGILGQEGRTDEAIALLEKAIARQPTIANWHLNLCALYRGKNQLDRALQCGLEAVRLSPDTANHRVELALTYLTRGERDLAGKHFREGIGKEPESAAAHMGLGELLLALGDYSPGWMEYAWRNKLDQARGTLPKMTAAPWNGMRIPDGTILLVADQGFGDMIQFARYIPWVRERVPNLIIGWGPEVTALLGDHPDIGTCIPRWADCPPHDAYTLLSTLPQIFHTELHTIPWPGPYLAMKPDRVAHWRARLNAACKPGRLRVGIAWSGRPTHPNNARRSIRLATLAPVLANRDIDFVVLQKPFPEEDRAFANTCPNLHIISDELESFAETGAVIAGLDLVLAVDTAVVHLAGAIGAEAWVLVPDPSDWRWLIGRDDCVWYPTLRLFRQAKPTEWGPVMANVAAALRVKAEAKLVAA
jgi:ADP-heptose:LPS heptosyltransferase/Flp pilus assembly protein TadD